MRAGGGGERGVERGDACLQERGLLEWVGEG